MKVLPPALDLSIAGFAENDLFGRHQLASGLTNLLSASDDPLVVAVDGQWGAGKTTFLAMWSDQLKREGFPVIRFDAFEHDYVEDPFLALASEVIALAGKLTPKDAVERKQLIEKTMAAGKVIVRHGAGAALKVVTLGTLDALKASDEIAEAIADAVKSASDDYLEDALTNHAAHRASLNRFRSALTELPALLKPPKAGEQQKPLIFIIDELDRCRPVFALQTLERIKHFFAVDNIHFVLGVNLAQLRTSVAAAYGVGVDGGQYLQKFIHLTFHLTSGEGISSAQSLERFVDYLLAGFNIPQGQARRAKRAAEVVKGVATRHDLSLRAIERIMMTLALATAFIGEGEFAPHAILGSLCALKVQEPTLYAKAKRGSLQYGEVAIFFNFPVHGGMWTDNREFWDEVAWWWAVCANGGHDGRVKTFIEERIETSLGVNEIIPWVANEVIDRLQPV